VYTQNIVVWQDAQWKARLTSMEEFMEHVKGMEEVPSDVASFLIQGIAVLPGWSEKNFQVSLISVPFHRSCIKG
jgi:hypothetical protein